MHTPKYGKLCINPNFGVCALAQIWVLCIKLNLGYINRISENLCINNRMVRKIFTSYQTIVIKCMDDNHAYSIIFYNFRSYCCIWIKTEENKYKSVSNARYAARKADKYIIYGTSNRKHIDSAIIMYSFSLFHYS